MAKNNETASLAQILAALGSETRLSLVNRLAEAETFGSLSITELNEGSGLTRQALTRHLDTLASAGLLARQKPGRATWYELKIDAVNRAIEALEEIAKRRAHSVQRLKSARKRILG